LAKEIENGANVRGYYHWSLLDNFEWIKGFGPRFGLVHIDYETLKRTKRSSAHFYSEIIRAHAPAEGIPQTEILESFQKRTGKKAKGPHSKSKEGVATQPALI